MEMTDLHKITQGISGAQAAGFIHDNDTQLFWAAESCKRELDANQALIDNAQGGSVNFHTPLDVSGTNITVTISQNASTRYITERQNTLSGLCYADNTNSEILNRKYDVKNDVDVAEIVELDYKDRPVDVSIDAIYDYVAVTSNTIKNLANKVSELEEKLKAKKNAELDSLLLGDVNEDGWENIPFEDEWERGIYTGPYVEPKHREIMTPFKDFIKQTARLAEIANKVIRGEV